MSLPAPIRDTVEYSMIGRIPRVQAANHFEVEYADELHYVLIRGIDCPKPGEDFYREAWRVTRNLTRGVDVRFEVVDRDDAMVELADVFVVNKDPADIEGDKNVALELLRKGLGWFDGGDFEGADLYRQTEADAKASRVGLWSADDPVSR